MTDPAQRAESVKIPNMGNLNLNIDLMEFADNNTEVSVSHCKHFCFVVGRG